MLEGEIGAVADDGAGGFTGLPSDGNDAEVGAGGDAADNGRDQIGGGCGDPLDAQAVKVVAEPLRVCLENHNLLHEYT